MKKHKLMKGATCGFDELVIEKASCSKPKCKAKKGEPCKGKNGKVRDTPHNKRVKRWEKSNRNMCEPREEVGSSPGNPGEGWR